MSDDSATRLNQVQLVGRLAADAVQRELPSGDRLATFRLVIDRPDSDVLRVDGELRRRFWRAGAGVASRYEVEVGAARRLAKAS